MKTAVHFLLGAAGYFLFGKLGLYLAIPPSFASSIWPAAGFALALALMGKSWPVTYGVVAGSFLLNLNISNPTFSNLTFAQLSPAFWIAIGAGIQLRLLLWLYRKQVGHAAIPDRPSQVGRFLFLVGPVGCLIGASVGAATLFAHALIPFEAIIFTWLTWWSGDTIGVLLFAPLLLVLLSPEENASLPRKIQIGIPVLGVFLIILYLFFASINLQKSEVQQARAQTASQIFAEIDKRFQLAMAKLESFRAFYLASDAVSEAEFNTFFELVLRSDSTIKAVGWSIIVPHEERAEWEAHMQSSGYNDFQFTERHVSGDMIPARKRSEYFPILYIYPYAENMAAHGLDLGFESSRLKALQLARQLRKPVSTAPIYLAQETENQKAFVVYTPVIKANETNGTPRLQGYLSGVFRANSMFSDLITDAARSGLEIAIRDVSPGAGDGWLLAPRVTQPSDQQLLFTHPINIGERDYQFFVFPHPHALPAAKDWNSWWVMTAGVIFTILLQALILIITGNVKAIERKVADKTAELARARDKADQANQAKSNFLSNVSHELRTPLNAIINLIRMSLRAYSLHDARNYLHQADKASETLLALINQTLDLNKIESGKLELNEHPFALSDILEKMYATFSVGALEKGIAFKLALPETFPEELEGDALRIEQVLLNFCSNAIKFTEHGHVTLELHHEARDDNTIVLTFVIRDTGVGIPQALQAKLFQPFQQADNSTTRKYGGSGLGLSISGSLIELMQGSLSLESTPEQGTNVRVTLPLKRTKNSTLKKREDFLNRLQERRIQLPEPPETPQATNEEVRAPASSRPLANLRILVVEDVAVNQLIAKTLLEEAGASVSIAEDGKHALEKVADALPDVVLMDIQMPVMDGYEATQRLREQYDARTLPIIALSANAMEPDVQKCLSVGMNAHIAKPIEQSLMIEKIRSVCDAA